MAESASTTQGVSRNAVSEKQDQESSDREEKLEKVEERLNVHSHHSPKNSKREDADNHQRSPANLVERGSSKTEEFTRQVKLGPFAESLGCYRDLSATAKSKTLRGLGPKELLLFVLEGGTIVLKPSIRGEIPILIGGAFITLFFLWLFLVPIGYVTPIDIVYGEGIPGGFVLLKILIVPLCTAAVSIHRLFNNKALITHEEFIAEVGRLSWQKRIVKLPHEKLRAVEVTSSLYGQFVNIGELRLSTPYYDQPEIVISRIVNPSRFAPLLEALIIFCKENLSVDDFVDETEEDDPLHLHDHSSQRHVPSREHHS